jgi:hypothetical protein
MDHLDASLRRVVEAEPRAGVLDGVALRLEQMMGGDDRRVASRDALERPGGEHLEAWPGSARGHEQVEQDGRPRALVDLGERVEQHVEALVVELVAARSGDQ